MIAPDVGLREFTFDGAFPGKGTLECVCMYVCVYVCVYVCKFIQSYVIVCILIHCLYIVLYYAILFYLFIPIILTPIIYSLYPILGSSTQKLFYETAVQKLVADFMNGFNTTAIVYGQTGEYICVYMCM